MNREDTRGWLQAERHTLQLARERTQRGAQESAAPTALIELVDCSLDVAIGLVDIALVCLEDSDTVSELVGDALKDGARG